MNDVKIISIGRELITGRTVDTNSNYLARQITLLGAAVSSVYVIDDVLSDIVKTLKFSLKQKPALIITTGGLGPTRDDMTLKGVAKALGKRLEGNKRALTMIRKRYDMLYRQGLLHTAGLNEARIKMSILPSGAKPITNPAGTAPGVLIHHGETAIFCLPGVPSEMKGIFEMHIYGWIKTHISNGVWFEKMINVNNHDESILRRFIDRTAQMYPEVYIKSSPAGFDKVKSLDVFFTSTGKNKAYVQSRVNKAMKMLKSLIRDQ
ncbi:MAG: molybdopterin-binding protein [Deltaproteobacteria bacterium]|nr:molybdopterin-binding protein [Deltaproteobacteria bacterium]